MSFWVAKKHGRVTSSKSQFAQMDQMTLTIIKVHPLFEWKYIYKHGNVNINSG